MRTPPLPTRQDLSRLAAPLVLLAAVAAGTAALYAWSLAQTDDRRAAQIQAQAPVSRLEQQVADIEADEREFMRSVTRFRGTIDGQLPRAGQADRLAWLELARGVSARLAVALPDLELGAEQTVNWSGAGERLALRATTVSLETALWHEGDLFALLALAQRVGAGYGVPQACELALMAAGRGADAGPRLQASCELVWLYLGERDEGAEAAPGQRNGSLGGEFMDEGME